MVGDAVHCCEERGAAGGGHAVPDTEPSGEATDADRQRATEHLAGHGVVAPQGIANMAELGLALEDPESRLPDAVRELGRLLLDQIETLTGRINELKAKILERARESEDAKRLMGIPGVGPVCAMAFLAFAPPMEEFRRGRDFPAWLGLVPRQHSTGGKPRLGKVSKMGQRDPGRLLVSGAIANIRWAERLGASSTE